MPQYVNDDFDDDDYEDDPRESNALREVRKALRAAEKRNKELDSQLSEFRTQARQGALKESLEARGLNPKVAAFVPADITDKAAVDAWLDEYGDVFGGPAPARQDESGDPVAPEVQRHEATISSGSAPTGDEAQMAALIAGAKTPKELNQLLFGNPDGPMVS